MMEGNKTISLKQGQTLTTHNSNCHVRFSSVGQPLSTAVYTSFPIHHVYRICEANFELVKPVILFGVKVTGAKQSKVTKLLQPLRTHLYPKID